MQVKTLLLGILIFFLTSLLFTVNAQVNTVEFGKNRVQYKKMKWKFYQSENFNAYFNQGGLELGRFVAQVAEEELPSIEKEMEYSLQRFADIAIYNNYDDYKSSNIGLGTEWQSPGGVTKLVNNKIVVYYNGNHNYLKLQIRQGIARILMNNILFGDDIGEMASNATLLDLPTWLTDGYVSYIAENWSTEKDNDLKNALLSGNYKNFYQFAFAEPVLAGHAFWYYISERYRKEDVTYLLYLTRLYKSLNNASERVCKKKFKDVLEDFMQYEMEKYYKDIKQRRNAPKGRLSIVEELKKSDFYHFAANPNPKNNSYAVVQFTKGTYQVKYVNNFYESKTLVKFGVRRMWEQVNTTYPILAWDGKGSRLLVIYSQEGKSYMFVYDVIANIKRFQQEIKGFDQILDAGFMFDANTLLLSAVKRGHTDIFTYRIDNEKTTQITNDVYDDLDPSVVAFPNRTGIIFASNRPAIASPHSDTAIPSRNHFNIFLIDLNNNSEKKQISRLTNVKYGNARFPMQYNTNHFTYVNDENGIANRWAGFFSTQREGLDTLYYVGDEILRNPSDKELDSTLAAWQKPEPDSISYFQVYKDSTYTFPITNYQSSLLETRIAGNNGQVSEVRQEGNYKFLYKLRVDSLALRRRNVNARPTEYIKKLLQQDKLQQAQTINVQDTIRVEQPNYQFQNEFEPDTTQRKNEVTPQPTSNAFAFNAPFKKAKLYNYRLKFSADYVLAGISNNILLINRFQPYAGGAGPIQLNTGNDFNWTLRIGVSDLFEDIKFIGGIRFGGNSLTDKDAFVSFQNYKKRIDWGLTYYRSNVTNYWGFFDGIKSYFDNKVVTHIYQFNISYPFNEVKSLRATVGIRRDKGTIRPYLNYSDPYGGSFQFPEPSGLDFEDSTSITFLSHLEYVHDNTINPTQNIWNGLRWKIYTDFNLPTSNSSSLQGKTMFNIGVDARHYLKIYRNFIWAVRAAGDFSFGDAKMIYYLGGADGWVDPKFYAQNRPDPNQRYAFQTLAVNLRGFYQNIANGNNAIVLNSELRLPVFTTFLNSPINNAFIRNFQLIQFIDLGTAWSGSLSNMERPTSIYASSDPGNPVTIRKKAGGVGPFAGGYGFGVRSTLLGYFLKLDAGWPMDGLFKGKTYWYFALGFDF